MTHRLTHRQLDEFDKLDVATKCAIFNHLGQAEFITQYGGERIPDLTGRIVAEPDPFPAVDAKPSMKYPDGNPKTKFGIVKPGDWHTPTIPYLEYGLAHLQGSLKYGPFNWRDDPISISTYMEAAKRHMDLYKAGQRSASDTGIHHLAHAMTCLSIIIDAEAHGSLIDDRFAYRDSGDKEKPFEILENYIDNSQERVRKIREQWTGFAEAQQAPEDKTR